MQKTCKQDPNHTEHFKCRIYILKGFNLAPIGGGNGKSYIVVQIQDKVNVEELLATGFDSHFYFSDDSNVRPNTINPG